MSRLRRSLSFLPFLWLNSLPAHAAAPARQSGRAQPARAYGPDEPDYTLEDLRRGLNS